MPNLKQPNNDTPAQETCGIIMPISASTEYPKEHWESVKTILSEIIKESGFIPNLVSEANEVGIIHNRIVENIYNNPIVICDVSSKNPNVMFELGLRLAFDKATIIVKDDVTNYIFDTGVIEHLEYPKSLNYVEINKFKDKLKNKLEATYEASKNKDYSTFLKRFVQYKNKPTEIEIDSGELILKRIDELNNNVVQLAIQSRTDTDGEIARGILTSMITSRFKGLNVEEMKELEEITRDEIKSDIRRVYPRSVRGHLVPLVDYSIAEFIRRKSSPQLNIIQPFFGGNMDLKEFEE